MALVNAQPLLWHFHHAKTGTLSHLVACPATRRAALIDPVLDFDAGAARVTTETAGKIAAVIRAESLALDWVLETHIHADHLSSAQFFRQQFGARVAIGVSAREVQCLYAPLFGMEDGLVDTCAAFDRLWHDEDRFAVGELEVRVIATPGHTRDGVTYRVGGHAFVGDTVFRADFGTARADLVGGDARALFESIAKLYALPPETLLHFCHDYPKGANAPTAHMSVRRLRADNVHVSATTRAEDFVALRRSRDATLPLPELIIPALQVNIAAGRLPRAGAHGIAYLRMPLNVIGHPRAS